jgi:hypothetical protein
VRITDGGALDRLGLGREHVVDVRVRRDGRHGRVMAREYGVEAVTRAIAFWMREAAMSSIAFVIFFVVWADLIFCR